MIAGSRRSVPPKRGEFRPGVDDVATRILGPLEAIFRIPEPIGSIQDDLGGSPGRMARDECGPSGPSGPPGNWATGGGGVGCEPFGAPAMLGGRGAWPVPSGVGA